MSKTKNTKNVLTPKQIDELLIILKTRFDKNLPTGQAGINRHKDIKWNDLSSKLKKNNDKLWSLNEMEKTGGEPDVVGFDKKLNEYIFCDCSAESPADRRSLCYDRKALDARKENKPKDNAVDFAAAMGIELLTEEQYRELQKLGNFDLKTSSWVKTPDDIRKLGGAIFCDRRYNNVFTYHNGADSYYAARGFRGVLKV